MSQQFPHIMLVGSNGRFLLEIQQPVVTGRSVVSCSPGAKKMFRFKTGDADSPRAGPPTESPYLLSPVGRENPLGNTIVSPKRAPRKIARSPFKDLDAPALQDDFYLNLVDWSAQNVLAVGLGTCVYLWSACTSKASPWLVTLTATNL